MRFILASGCTLEDGLSSAEVFTCSGGQCVTMLQFCLSVLNVLQSSRRSSQCVNLNLGHAHEQDEGDFDAMQSIYAITESAKQTRSSVRIEASAGCDRSFECSIHILCGIIDFA